MVVKELIAVKVGNNFAKNLREGREEEQEIFLRVWETDLGTKHFILKRKVGGFSEKTADFITFLRSYCSVLVFGRSPRTKGSLRSEAELAKICKDYRQSASDKVLL